MDFGLPPQLAFLKKFKIVLLHWTLLKLEVFPDAVLLPPSEPSPTTAGTSGASTSDGNGGARGSTKVDSYPVVICSHGNGGTRTIASSLLEEIVSWGAVVIALEHRDGSCTLTTGSDGELMYIHIYIYIYIFFWVVFCFFADVDGVGGGFVPLRLVSLRCLLLVDGNAITPIN